jgi:hypothetical protein
MIGICGYGGGVLRTLRDDKKDSNSDHVNRAFFLKKNKVNNVVYACYATCKFKSEHCYQGEEESIEKKFKKKNMKMKVHLTEIIHGEKIKAEVGRLKMKKN